MCRVQFSLEVFLDRKIRGAAEVELSRITFGSIIQKGEFRTYPNFTTFDSISMHPVEFKKKDKYYKSVEFYTYVHGWEGNETSSGEGLAVKYENRVVHCTFRKKTTKSTDEGCQWVELLDAANTLMSKRRLPTAYFKIFDKVHRSKYNINDLANRLVISGPGMVKKFKHYSLKKRLGSRNNGGMKMKDSFKNGLLYPCLSKKSSQGSIDCGKVGNGGAVDSSLSEGRMNKVPHFLATVVRSANEATRNSAAFTFANDSKYFICPLNTPQMKSAGEQQTLAEFVVPTGETDARKVFEFVKQQNFPIGKDDLLVECNLTGMTLDWDFDKLIILKNKFPHVTTQVFQSDEVIGKCVNLCTKENVPTKYSPTYNCLFSPAEVTTHNIKFEESTYLSSMAKLIGVDNVCRNPSAKSTVSINNIKGCVAKVENDFEELAVSNCLGIGCDMKMTEAERLKMPSVSVISEGHDTDFFFHQAK